MGKELIKGEYEGLIFTLRGRKVMIDADLALLYQVSTKGLKQQVKRNGDRFPEDFMFELTKKEKDELVTNCDRLATLKHSGINPMAFTEQGVAMLSSVLRSKLAIQINIEIMRTFARYRSLLREHEELKKELMAMDSKLDRAFQVLMSRLDSLHETKKIPIRKIGFRVANSGD